MDATDHGNRTQTQQGPKLILQNGRMKGTGRYLGFPSTLLGQAEHCDIRFNVEGISPLHCLIVVAPTGIVIRDLHSKSGTYVNGERISSCPLHEDDLITIGPFQFRLEGNTQHQPETSASALENATDAEENRVIIAAVAAQHTALLEKEEKIRQQQLTLDQQKAQVAEHLSEKRKQLMELQTKIQQSRQKFHEEREDFQKSKMELMSSLSEKERTVLEEHGHVQKKKERLEEFHRKLKLRFQRHWVEKEQEIEAREREIGLAWTQLETEHDELEKEKQELADRCKHFNTEVELGKRRLQEESTSFRQYQTEQTKRLEAQRQELSQIENELAQRECAYLEAEEALFTEKSKVEGHLNHLREESKRLESRVHQARKALQSLEKCNAMPANVTKPVNPFVSPPKESDSSKTEDKSQSKALVRLVSQPLLWRPRTAMVSANENKTLTPEEQTTVSQLQEICDELEDQRLCLAEHWQSLQLYLQARDEQLRDISRQVRQALVNMESQAKQLDEKHDSLASWNDDLHLAQEKMTALQSHMVGWQSRLHTKEQLWDNERQKVLDEANSKLVEAREQVQLVVSLRNRWVAARQQEVTHWQKLQESWNAIIHRFVALCDERRQTIRLLQEERRALTHKTLAVEQYRQECLTRASDPASAERRMERLRKRWEAAQNATLKAHEAEQKELDNEIKTLQLACQEFQTKIVELDAEKRSLTDMLTDLQHSNLHVEQKVTTLQQEVQRLTAEKDTAVHTISVFQNELDSVARHLLDDNFSVAKLPLPVDGSQQQNYSDKAA